MNDECDPFEMELASFRPHDPSPELQQRLFDHQARASVSRYRKYRRLIFASGLAAACLVLIVLFGRGPVNPVGPKQTVVKTQTLPETTDNRASSLLAYQRAFDRSPEELDALLDRQTVSVQQTSSEPLEIRPFIRSESTINALLGDY